MKKKTICFTGGGTLGHIYPMIPIILKIKEKYQNVVIIFIGTKKGFEKKIIEEYKEIDKAIYLDSIGFERKFTIKNIKTIYLVIKNNKKVKKIFKNVKPDIVVGFGGYVTYSVIKQASKMKIKTIIHEQNSVLGLANRLLINKVDKVLLTYKIPNVNGEVVGNPRLSDFYEKSKKTNIDEDIDLLVVGGSNGAKKINDVVLSCEEELKIRKIKTTLITGKKYYEENKEKIEKINNQYLKIIAFERDMFKTIKRSRIIVSRAGSTTISEVMALEKVCIFIPSPNVTANHQVKNALFFKERDAAIVIEEENLTPNVLLKEIIKVKDNAFLQDMIKQNLKRVISYNSKDIFVKEIEKLW